MTTPLMLGKDINGATTYRLDFTDTGYQVQLSPSVAQSIVVPENANEAWFSYSAGSNVYVNPKQVATLPTNLFLPTFNDLNPVARRVIPGQTLSFISGLAAEVKVSFYRNVSP